MARGGKGRPAAGTLKANSCCSASDGPLTAGHTQRRRSQRSPGSGGAGSLPSPAPGLLRCPAWGPPWHRGCRSGPLLLTHVFPRPQGSQPALLQRGSWGGQVSDLFGTPDLRGLHDARPGGEASRHATPGVPPRCSGRLHCPEGGAAAPLRLPPTGPAPSGPQEPPGSAPLSGGASLLRACRGIQPPSLAVPPIASRGAEFVLPEPGSLVKKGRRRRRGSWKGADSGRGAGLPFARPDVLPGETHGCRPCSSRLLWLRKGRGAGGGPGAAASREGPAAPAPPPARPRRRAPLSGTAPVLRAAGRAPPTAPHSAARVRPPPPPTCEPRVRELLGWSGPRRASVWLPSAAAARI